MVFLLIFLGTLYYFILDILDAVNWNGLEAIAYFQYWSVIRLCLKDKIKRILLPDVVNVIEVKTICLSMKAESRASREYLEFFSCKEKGAGTNNVRVFHKWNHQFCLNKVRDRDPHIRQWWPLHLMTMLLFYTETKEIWDVTSSTVKGPLSDTRPLNLSTPWFPHWKKWFQPLHQSVVKLLEKGSVKHLALGNFSKHSFFSPVLHTPLKEECKLQAHFPVVLNVFNSCNLLTCLETDFWCS